MCQTTGASSLNASYIEEMLQANRQKSEEQTKANLAEITRTQTKQMVGKDVVVPAKKDGKSNDLGDSQGNNLGRQLPPPKKGWDGVQDNEQSGLIAIIGSVLAIQARTQSRFWSCMWQQASQSMMIAVQFAPIIAQAVENAAEQGAEATRSSAKKELAEGITCTCSFALACFMGGAMEATDPEATGANDSAKTVTNEGDDQALNDTTTQDQDMDIRSDALKERNAPGQTETNTFQDDADNTIGSEDGNNAKRLEDVQNKAGKAGKTGMQRFAGWAGKAVNSAMLSQAMAQAVNGFTGNYYDKQQADHQQAQGTYEGDSKECESYQQFYNQSFSRTDEIRQGANQSIEYAMNILKGAADTITQAVMAMFRG